MVRTMTFPGVFADLAALLHPRPTPDVDSGLDEVVLADVDQQVADDRADFRHHAELAWEDSDTDPVLTQIAAARGRIREAEAELRLLLAYAREYVQPRPYRLQDLADAAAMSTSGVRTAYGETELAILTERLGRRPRRRQPDHDPQAQP
jgi:hypothetical protein